MLSQRVQEIVIKTRGRGFYEFTSQLRELVRKTNLKTGLVTLNIQHTSASLLIQENADPDVRYDLERFFERLVPDGSPMFSHTIEGDDDMPAHIRSALTQTSLSIIIHNGELALGTWQGVYLWEHRKSPYTRRIIVHIIGE